MHKKKNQRRNTASEAYYCSISKIDWYKKTLSSEPKYETGIFYTENIDAEM